MFALFLHESMTPFHQTVTSFPTIVFSVFLVVCILYWAVAALGLVDIDIIDFDMDGDIDIDDSIEFQGGIAGVLLKLGLNGVPFTIILTIISLVGWVISYYCSLYGLKLLPNFWAIQITAKFLILVGTIIAAALITAQLIKPLRSFLKKMEVDETKHILGQVAIIRSAIADNNRGEATLNDGGAGLILNVRTTNNDSFSKGDEVVIIEHHTETNLYRVIAKSEFKADISDN